MLERLESPDAIVFGRLNFDDGDTFPLGTRMILDDSRDLIVVSWAAPIAKAFYEATPSEPAVTLRRRLRTEREELSRDR